MEPYLCPVEVLVGVTSPNIKKPGDTKFLLSVPPDGPLRLPSRLMSREETTLMVASSLLDTLTGLKARIAGVGWVDLPQVGVADNTDRMANGRRFISVVYGCMVPETVTNGMPGTTWMSLSEIRGRLPLYMDHWDLLHFIARRV